MTFNGIDKNLSAVISVLVINHQNDLQRTLCMLQNETWNLIKRKRRHFLRRWKTSHDTIIQYFQHNNRFAVIEALHAIPIYYRTIGSKDRATDWWERVVLGHFDETQWLENFRMTRETFFALVDIVREPFARDPNAFLPGLTEEKKVGIALYRLASCGEYRCTGNVFGVHKLTVWDCVHVFVRAVNSIMRSNYLNFSTSKETCEEIATAIERRYLIPQVIGAIDGSHIPITAPSVGAANFRCRKGFTSIVLQAVVDHQRLFRDVTVKHPGSNHDATVLADSHLYQNAQQLIPESAREYGGHVMPFVILGDPAYPLLDWLMVDYRHEATAEQISFNLRLNSARVIVEIAFGRLKARWRILCKKSDLDVYFMPEVVLTCCILHNYVEIAKNPFMVHWLQFVRDVEAENRIRPIGNQRVNQPQNGQAVRERMSNYMSNEYPLLQRRN